MFPNVWKFGYANIDFSENEVTYGLYPITWEKNDIQIKDVEIPDEGSALSKENLSQLTGYSYNPFNFDIEEHAMRELEDDVEDVLSDRWLRHYENDFLCREIIFSFIDEFGEFMELELKEEYRLEEVEDGFYQYLQLWIDSALGFNNESELPSSYFGTENLLSHLSSEFSENEKESVHNTVEDRIENDEQLRFRYRVSTQRFRIGI